MQEHIIRKDDGTAIIWNKAKNGNYYCLLYNDNKRKYTFSPTTNLNCELFMIGGGGPGGYFFGGGGGAGAAYTNKNYTFEKNKTYNFEIGTGGKCDIKDIDKLFKSGLLLNIYNNTTPILNNISFMGDDYTSLGIQNSGMIQSFVVNNISIPSTVFHNNTTYIWNGYVKTDNTDYISININSSIKVIIWIDKYIYSNDNTLIDGINITDKRIIQLEANRYYNIKIIAYNDNTINNNFNITFDNCKFFNFDKTNEEYNYDKATDTIISYRNNDNSFETIRCNGGGFGGCGYYNQNTNLDGGCGGGSGINKINGKSVIQAIYNGYDGAIGDYCGGGGGIMSVGNNNMGGNGKIINWFDENLIFGAGGNAANLKELRQLGYGCGGNGGECCYYSKLLINNNGNNGCVLLYINLTPDVIEHFSDNEKNNIMLPASSLPKQLIDESFAIFPNMAKLNFAAQAEGSDPDTASVSSRINFFKTKNTIFNKLATYQIAKSDLASLSAIGAVTGATISTTIADPRKSAGSGSAGIATVIITDLYAMETYIYDIITISHLFATIYRLYWYHFNITLNNDPELFKTFITHVSIQINGSATSYIDTATHTIYLASNWNNIISTLNIQTAISQGKPRDIYHSKSLYKNSDVIEKFNANNTDNAPYYHNATPVSNSYSSFTSASGMIADIAGKYLQSEVVTIINSSSTITSSNLNSAYETILASNYTGGYVDGSWNDLVVSTASSSTTEPATAQTNATNYLKERIFLYLEVFNIILNTDSTAMLSIIKYWTHYYNIVYYNTIIQYTLFKIQSNRLKISSVGVATAADVVSIPLATDASTKTIYSNLVIDIDAMIANMNIVSDALNTNSSIKNAIDSVIGTTKTLNDNGYNYYDEQQLLNKSINEYNKNLEAYNTIVSQYQIMIIVSIILSIIIVYIFSTSSIDVNSKISIYIALIFVSIIILILYRNNSDIIESFSVVTLPLTNRALIPVVNGATTEGLQIPKYKLAVNKYINKLNANLASLNISEVQKPIIGYSQKMSLVRQEKSKSYKIKRIKLDNSIEVLKKSIDFYYYIVILISISIIIFIFGLILYLINPNMIIQIIVLCMIPFIILIYNVAYNIHKSTRMIENKNYWANFNPTDETIKNF